MVFKQKGFIHVVESPGFKLGFSKINTRSVAEEGGDIFFSSTVVIDRFFFLKDASSQYEIRIYQLEGSTYLCINLCDQKLDTDQTIFLIYLFL